jgi:hypothetical protein
VLRDANATDSPARPGDPDGGLHGRAVADALQHRVRAEAAGELAHALGGFLAAFRDAIGGAELLGERHAILVAAHDDDLLGA